MRRFRVPELETQPPIVGPLHPVTGQNAVQTGKLHGRRLGVQLPETVAGRNKSPANAARSATVDRRPEPGGHRAAVQMGRRHAQRLAHRLGQVARELDPGLRSTVWPNTVKPWLE